MDNSFDPNSLSALLAGIIAKHDALRDSLTEHLSRQDRALERILEQAKLTNGRVNGAEQRISAVETFQQEAKGERALIRQTQHDNANSIRSLRQTIRRAIWTGGGIWITGAAVLWMIEHHWLEVPGLSGH